MQFFIISPQIYCLFQIPVFVPHPPSLVSPPVLLRQRWVHPPRTPRLWLLLPSHCAPDWNWLRGDSLPCLKSHLKSSSLFPMIKSRVGVSIQTVIYHCINWIFLFFGTSLDRGWLQASKAQTLQSFQSSLRLLLVHQFFCLSFINEAYFPAFFPHTVEINVT